MRERRLHAFEVLEGMGREEENGFKNQLTMKQLAMPDLYKLSFEGAVLKAVERLWDHPQDTGLGFSGSGQDFDKDAKEGMNT